MATDIAKIGFGVETSQLEKGVATLNTFKNTAKSANSTAQSIGTVMNSSSKVFAAAVSAMSKSIASLVSVTKGATVEQIAAANEASDFADRVYRAAKAQDSLTSSVQRASKALKNYSIFMKAASNESVMSRINRLTGVTGLSGLSAEERASYMEEAMGRKKWLNAIGESVSSRGLTEAQQISRFNTGNIAAQFQDIAVTAAMGMNPMTIALQQGSQLVGVLNLMEKPLSSIVIAFKSLFNTTSLVTMGLVGLVAAGMQMVDWTSVANNTLGLLSDAFGAASDNVEIFASALIGLSFTGVIAGASSLTAILGTLGKVLGPIITFFSKFFTILSRVLFSKFTLIATAITGVVYALGKLRNYLQDTFGFDISFGLWDKLTSLIKKATNALKDFFNVSNVNKEGWDNVSQSMGEELDNLQNKYKSLSMGDKESDEFLKRMELYQKAVKEKVNLEDRFGLFNKTGFELIDEHAKAYANLNAKIKKTEENIKSAAEATKSWNNLIEKNNQDFASAQLEMRLIGADTYTSEYEKIKAGLTNQAVEANIPLTPEKIAYINESADGLARVREETEKLKDSFDTSKSITNSFFQDMRTGLRDGVSMWESFGNAVTNVLDRILSKMMDIGVDMLFQSIGTLGTSGGSEKFSWGNVAKFIGSWFSDSVAAANGGVFSNGVYSSPTLFKFAKGGKFGVMGEAGPEAVMPLRRGRDGSLGVQADGLGGNDVVVNVYNNSNAQASVNQRQTSQGTEIDVMIDQLVAEKMGQPGTSSNNALTAFNNRRLIAR